MTDISKMEKIIYEKLSLKRFKHSMGVAETAVLLANKYGENEEKAEIAGILHDITKDMDYKAQLQMCKDFDIIITKVEKNSPSLLHSLTAAYYIKNNLGVDDEDIINAVKFHTTGRANMSTLEKIIFLADFIEPDRDFEGVELVRPIAFLDIDKAMIEALIITIKEVIGKKQPLQINTLECYNDILMRAE